jgi:cytochrome P450
MLNLLDPDVLSNPYPTYNQLREDHPIFEIAPGGIWLVSRHKDVNTGLADYEIYTSSRKTEVFSPDWLKKSCRSDLYLTPKDPPEYLFYRKTVTKQFTLNKVEGLTYLLQETAEDLVKSILTKKRIEFLSDFTYPYITKIISKIVGLNNHLTPEDVFRWVQALESINTKDNKVLSRNGIEHLIDKQKNRFRKAIEEKRNNIADDLVSDLLCAEIKGRELTSEQITDAVELIIRSGFQTTVHVLANAIVQLKNHEDLLEKLVQSPSLVSPFINELLRLYSSLPMVVRHCTKNTDIYEKTIPCGDQVLFCLAAANRDPRIFTNPDSFDLSRKMTNTLAFGTGPHTCIGLNLAKLELQIALEHLVPHINTMSIPGIHELNWCKTYLFRGLKSLPINFR